MILKPCRAIGWCPYGHLSKLYPNTQFESETCFKTLQSCPAFFIADMNDPPDEIDNDPNDFPRITDYVDEQGNVYRKMNIEKPRHKNEVE